MTDDDDRLFSAAELKAPQPAPKPAPPESPDLVLERRWKDAQARLDATLVMLVRLGREAHHGGRCRHARVGNLVVEISKYEIDPDGIGWLVAHGRAPYERPPELHVGDCPMTNADPGARTRCVCDHHDTPREYLEGGGGQRGGATREVWDIEPLSGRRGNDGGPMRWENAEFVALPESLAELAREAFARPKRAP